MRKSVSYYVLLANIVWAMCPVRADETREPMSVVSRAGAGFTGRAGVESPENAGVNAALLPHAYFFFSEYRRVVPGYFLFTGMPVGKYTISASALAEQNNTENLMQVRSGSAGLAFALKNIRLGTHFWAGETATNKKWGTDLGLVYRIETDAQNLFSLHELALGARLRLGTNASGQFYYEPQPGVSLLAAKHPLLMIRFFLDFPIADEFQKVPTYYGTEFRLFHFFLLRAGISGNDFFTSENTHLGAGLQFATETYSLKLDAYSMRRMPHTIRDFNAIDGFSFSATLHVPEIKEEEIDTDKILKFSPDKNGKNMLILDLPEQIKTAVDYSVTILGQKSVKTFDNTYWRNAEEKQKHQIAWNGKDDKNLLVDDGMYSAQIHILSAKKEISSQVLARIKVIKEEKAIKLNADPILYSIETEGKPVTLEVINVGAEKYQIEYRVRNRLRELVFNEICDSREIQCVGKWAPSTLPSPAGQYTTEAVLFREGYDNLVLEGPRITVTYGTGEITIELPSLLISEDFMRNEGIPVKIRTPPVKGANVEINIFTQNGRLVHSEILGENFALNYVYKGKGVPKKYSGTLSVSVLLNENGNKKNLGNKAIEIDAEPPVITADLLNKELQYNFYPSDDPADYLRFRLSAQDKSPLRLWGYRLLSSKGQILDTTMNQGELPGQYAVSGMHKGAYVPDSLTDYLIQFFGNDSAGNLGQSKSIPIRTGLRMLRQKSRDIPNKEGLGETESLKAELPNIVFHGNSDKPLKGSEKIFQSLAPALKQFSGFQIIIEGHVHDPPGKKSSENFKKFQMKLSLKRAQRVLNKMAVLGVKKSHMKAIGKGGAYPIARDSSAYEISRNRRVTIRLEKIR